MKQLIREIVTQVIADLSAAYIHQLIDWLNTMPWQTLCSC